MRNVNIIESSVITRQCKLPHLMSRYKSNYLPKHSALNRLTTLPCHDHLHPYAYFKYRSKDKPGKEIRIRLKRGKITTNSKGYL